MDNLMKVFRRVQAAQQSCAERDTNINLVRKVRRGKLHEMFPHEFADDMPQSIVGNTIDTMARDQAELMATLPTLQCYSRNMTTESDERRAMNRNKIGSYYWSKSRLDLQNVDFTDSVNSYGFGVYVVEPDFDSKCPRIRWDSPFGAYYQKRRYGDVYWYAKVRTFTVGELIARYPEKAYEIKNNGVGTFESSRSEATELEVIHYVDDDQYMMYIPACNNEILSHLPNRIGKCPVVVAERRDQDEKPRGQYDDVVFPTLAAARMQMYMLRAADMAVNGPIALPNDVTDFEYGPDVPVYSDNPEKIRRISLELPGEAFALTDKIERNIREGSRYPEVRGGGTDASIITGKGVEALLGTMDTQVKTMQTIVGLALEQVTALCFQMDVTYWPDMRKTIHGVVSGRPYELTYTPSKDIDGVFGCKVTYGFAAGLSPAQAIVAMLQLRGDGAISRDTFRAQLPFDIDVTAEQIAVDTQEMEDAMKQGLAALLQAVGPMMQAGQDPLMVINAGAKALQMRRKGKTIEEAILEAFKPPEPTPEEQAQMAAQAAEEAALGGGAPGGGNLPGMGQSGRLLGVPPGQAGMPPGGMPNVQALMSALKGEGGAQMEAGIMRKRGIGT